MINQSVHEKQFAINNKYLSVFHHKLATKKMMVRVCVCTKYKNENYYDNISHFSRDTLLIFLIIRFMFVQNVCVIAYAHALARSCTRKLQAIQQSRIENIN